MYIFGYGSLMNSASRKLTGQTGETIPAIVSGLVRYWGKIDDSYVLSPLVVNLGNGQVNGVLLKIDEQALADFDRRERGYHRIQLSPQTIQLSDIGEQPVTSTDTPSLASDDVVWVYVKDKPEPPCSLSPIMQTYVDTVLTGCLEISESFAQHFIKHTVGWHFPRENDRESPKYGNLAGVQPHHQKTIDALLSEVS
ncbi:gamma-glutamylcyclotransferase family protein [uncultured Vibrio sp.]|mgnify:CR=1 FL=1|uniref:gamma-glutamylcyclotransferase family protein n=1 Tax=uncultured Vibrio sp. TaxID=114054 RepID=UPI00090F48CF|nr:gamma-glutamylcyclotransferase family protein [uncultured Vibrio sp.]OIQ25692.1 MAG: gamma-glutamylcyclotransferase [Vibrio sp. MedPE-SWchi]